MRRSERLKQDIAFAEERLQKENYKPYQFERIVITGLLERWKAELTMIQNGWKLDTEEPNDN